jgi:predicted transcriptional regulator
MIKPEQIRAARALLRIEQRDLARRAEISVATVRRLETEHGTAQVTAGTVGRVQAALETAGAEFIDNGVRRRAAAVRSEEAERLVRDIMAIADRAARRKVANPDFSEADLYDEAGLPA